MITFIAVDLLTIWQVNLHSKSITLKAITIIGSVFQVLTYTLVAISNPGITTNVDFDTETEEEYKRYKSIYKRFCKICDLPMLPRSRHCSECNVCIKGYDHHCPWTSKCIGQNNLNRFYLFAIYVPLFLVYCIVTISLVGNWKKWYYIQIIFFLDMRVSGIFWQLALKSNICSFYFQFPIFSVFSPIPCFRLTIFKCLNSSLKCYNAWICRTGFCGFFFWGLPDTWRHFYFILETTNPLLFCSIFI